MVMKYTNQLLGKPVSQSKSENSNPGVPFLSSFPLVYLGRQKMAQGFRLQPLVGSLDGVEL